MRKHDREIADTAILRDILDRCHTGRLGTNSNDGWPMVKPLNFVYLDGRIYFHSAMEGEKIEHIKSDDRVCFEVDLPVAYVRAVNQPCEATYLYRSVIAKGRAVIVSDRDEKVRVIEHLMNKYQPGFGIRGMPEDKLAITAVIRIDIHDLVGKEHLKSGRMRESALNAIEADISLPIVLDREQD